MTEITTTATVVIKLGLPDGLGWRSLDVTVVEFDSTFILEYNPDTQTINTFGDKVGDGILPMIQRLLDVTP